MNNNETEIYESLTISSRTKSIIFGWLRGNTNFVVPNGIKLFICKYYQTQFFIYKVTKSKQEQLNINPFIEISEFDNFYINCESYFVIKNDQLLVNGANRSGQLGIETLNDCNNWEIHKYFKNKNAPQIISNTLSSACHTFIYTKSNKLFSCGNNSCGVLGLNGNDKKTINEINIKQLNFKSKLKSISSGAMHSIFLLMNGNVFGVGSNRYGQVAQSKNVSQINKITQIEKLSNIVQIGCCNNTTYVLDRKGQLYSFGHNIFGLLGIGFDKSDDGQFLIHNINKTIKFKNIFVGGYHIFCEDNQNKIYGFGSNYDGQCGFNRDINKICSPKYLSTIENIKKIQCGSCHTIITSNNENYYSCGANYAGACLVLLQKPAIFLPHLIDLTVIEKKIKMLKLGCQKIFLEVSGSFWKCYKSDIAQIDHTMHICIGVIQCIIIYFPFLEVSRSFWHTSRNQPNFNILEINNFEEKKN